MEKRVAEKDEAIEKNETDENEEVKSKKLAVEVPLNEGSGLENDQELDELLDCE